MIMVRMFIHFVKLLSLKLSYLNSYPMNNYHADKRFNKLSRRQFVSRTAAFAAGLTIIPGGVITAKGRLAPSDKLNIAGIGVGGMGRSNMGALKSENIVALVDVDWKKAEKCFADFPQAKKYYDYRIMLDELKGGVDAVVIATADHTHAVIASMAMKMGKHVYVQKPLTHSVSESRYLAELAREKKVVTQMGNQGNSGEGIRQMCEWIWDGVIGEITHVDTWTNRPIWPQGLERPTETVKVPKTLNWDVFIGPAKFVPYHPIYHPWNWRGWWDFGTGALGDMACHIMDPVFKALKLKYPVAVQGSSTKCNSVSAPLAEVVTYRFPARDNLPKVAMPPVTIKWYDGGLLPERPEGLPEGVILGRDGGGGCLFHGTRGTLMCGVYGKDPILLPYERMDKYQKPPQILRRVTTSHEMDWARACKEGYDNVFSKGTEPSSNFDYSGPLNEMVVMGVTAVRLQDLRRELLWDGENMKFLNISDTDEIRVVTSDKFTIIDGDPKFETKRETLKAKTTAEELIKHTYRQGWAL
jgi:predicted dehydrogenase